MTDADLGGLVDQSDHDRVPLRPQFVRQWLQARQGAQVDGPRVQHVVAQSSCQRVVVVVIQRRFASLGSVMNEVLHSLYPKTSNKPPGGLFFQPTSRRGTIGGGGAYSRGGAYCRFYGSRGPMTYFRQSDLFQIELCRRHRKSFACSG